MQASADEASTDIASPSPVRVGGVAGWVARAVAPAPRSLLRPGRGADRVAGRDGLAHSTRARRARDERGRDRAGRGERACVVDVSLARRELDRSAVARSAPRRSPRRASPELDEWSRAQLDEARSRGRGVVIATAHAGNWELAAAALAEAHALTAVVKPMRVGWVDRFCRESRGARGIALAPPDHAMGRSRAALRRGGTVAMMIDQVPDRARHSYVVDFLCGRADVDRSPAVLAAAMRVPLVVAVSRRTRGRAAACSRSSLSSSPPIAVGPRLGRPRRRAGDHARSSGGSTPTRASGSGCTAAGVPRLAPRDAARPPYTGPLGSCDPPGLPSKNTRASREQGRNLAPERRSLVLSRGSTETREGPRGVAPPVHSTALRSIGGGDGDAAWNRDSTGRRAAGPSPVSW